MGKITNREHLKRHPFERLMEKVEKNQGPKGECWEMKSSIHKNGYGLIRIGDQMIRAHRFSWIYHNGKDIPMGLFVLHSCDNRCCVNPDHLSLGTNKQNVKEMCERGRSYFSDGETNPSAKLSSKEVIVIYKSCHNGVKTKVLSERFKVSASAILNIKNGHSWSTVTKHKDAK